MMLTALSIDAYRSQHSSEEIPLFPLCDLGADKSNANVNNTLI